MTIRDPHAALRALFAKARYEFVEPPILHDAGVFVEVAGEDLRRRLFLTNAADGAEMALRPDYTIPVCLHHLATGAAGRRASYAYLGPVFRQRAGEPAEFLQAGVESIGRKDAIAADADILRLALSAADTLDVADPAVRIGDSALFAAVVAALDLTSPWQRRLARVFGDTPRLRALIDRANGGASPPAGEPAFASADRADVEATAAELLASSGLAVIGGRTAAEIADRFVERAVLAQGIGERAAEVLTAFLAVAGPPAKASAAMAALARDAGISIGAVIDRFNRRNDAFAKRGINVGRLRFAADFGRRLDYYTGFVFELDRRRAARGRPIIGGGRYDRLMALIPHPGRRTGASDVPAVGFAIWLDRIARR